MTTIPEPKFNNKIKRISWKKIYSREYGVQYSEMAILCLSSKFKYHISCPTENTVIIPEENNTVFYIDDSSWVKLVESLNQKYTSHTEKLAEYEKGFIKDGNKYLDLSKQISKMNLKIITDKELAKFYLDYQDKLIKYSVYAWTSFILNNYISEKATNIINKYIIKTGNEKRRQEIINSLFHPTKMAAALELQHDVQGYKKVDKTLLNRLFDKYKWLSCLDIHNQPWTKKEFRESLKSFLNTKEVETTSLQKILADLKVSKTDKSYLLMAQKFVYIKDARDDFRRQSIFFSIPFFNEIARRMGINRSDLSYLQQFEVINFLHNKIQISKDIIQERKIGFVLYLDVEGNLVCVSGKNIPQILKKINLQHIKAKVSQLTGVVASQGIVTARVVIVKGIKDLNKVKKGDIMVAVTTHPDFIPAMRKASAFVTDEGGMTSHAAIVAREFGVPCIVGTKNATSILKDGDKVTVDAKKGIIKFS